MPAARRRVTLGAADQALSSLGNILILFAFARVSDVTTFGRVSIVWAILVALLSLMRGGIGTPIAIASDSAAGLKVEAAFALVASATCGFVGALGIGVVGHLLGLGLASWSLALGLPFLFCQDALRYYAIARGTPFPAIASDAVWAALSAAILFATWFGVDPGLEAVAIVWSGGAVASCAVLLGAMGLAPRITGFRHWVSRSLPSRLRYGAEALVGGLSALGLVALVALVLSEEAVAALRGVGTVMGPLNVMLGAVSIAVVPELRRSGRVHQFAFVMRQMSKVGWVATFAALTVGVVGHMLPPAIGRLLLGDSWTVTAEIIPIAAIEYVLLGWLAAVTGGIRAQGRAGTLLSLRLVRVGTTLVGGACGAVMVGSVVGVSWGLVAAAGLGVAAGAYMLSNDPARVDRRRSVS